MGIMQKTGAIALAVLVGFSVMTAMNSIKINSLDSQGDKIDNQFKSISGETVQISDSKQLKGLTAFNMFYAVDCRVTPWIVHINNKNNNAQHLNELKIEGTNHTAYFGNNNFRHVLEGTNYTATCAGASSVIYEGREAIEGVKAGAASTPFGNIESTLRYSGKAIGVFEKNPDNFLTASADIADAIENKIYNRIASESLWEQPSKDMEGVYGKVTFNVTNDFWVGGANSKNQLIAMKLAKKSKLKSGNNGWAIPPYFNGRRGSYFMPDGMKIKESADDKGKKSAFLSHEEDGYVEFGMMDYDDNNEFNNPGKAAMYAFRPRIETDQRRLVVSDHKAVASDEYDRSEYYKRKIEELIEHGKFRFCEGDKGYIQSNAGSISNSGEAEGQASWREDTVFPEIVLNKEVDDCLNYGGPDYINTEYVDESIRTNSCTVSDAVDKAHQGSIGAGDVPYYCGLARKSLDLGGSYEGNIKYLTPALYAARDGCPDKGRRVNLLSSDEPPEEYAVSVYQPVKSGNPNPDAYITDVDGNKRMYGSSPEKFSRLRWYIREWDNWRFRSEIDISNKETSDSDSNGKIIFKQNGEKVAVYNKKGKDSSSVLKNMKQDGSDKTIPDNDNFDDGGTIIIVFNEDGSGKIKYKGSLGLFEEEVKLDADTSNEPIQVSITAKGKNGARYDITADVESAALEEAMPAGCGN